MNSIARHPKSVGRLVLLLVAATFLSFVNAHAGFIQPPSMMTGKKFRAECGAKAFATIRKDPFLRRESWTKGTKCAQRRCQGAFIEDQDLSKVPQFSFGEEIDAAVRVQIAHGGPAKIVLIDVKGQQEGPELLDLGDFGTPGSAKIQTFQVTLPEKSRQTRKCQTAGVCAIAFQWKVKEKEVETYEICALITMK